MEIAIIVALIVWALSARGKKTVEQSAESERPNPRFPGAGERAGTNPNPIGRAGAHTRTRPGRATLFPKETHPQRRPAMAIHGEGVGHEGPRLWETPGAAYTGVNPPPSPWNAVEDPMGLAPSDATPVRIPGLTLAFDAHSLAQGVLYAEILARKGAGRRT